MLTLIWQPNGTGKSGGGGERGRGREFGKWDEDEKKSAPNCEIFDKIVTFFGKAYFYDIILMRPTSTERGKMRRLHDLLEW